MHKTRITFRRVGIVAVVIVGIAITHIACGQISHWEWRSVQNGEGPHKLPVLPYGPDGLEPHMNKEALTWHHETIHARIVTNLNRIIGGFPPLYNDWIRDYRRSDLEDDAQKWCKTLVMDSKKLPGRFSEATPRGPKYYKVTDQVRTDLRSNAGGHHNHSLFWKMMKKNGGDAPKGELAKMIQGEYGTFKEFQSKFTEAASKLGTNGWVWVTLDGRTLKIETTIGEDNPLMEGRDVLLGIDLWEHAYERQYGDKREDYVKAWWNLVNWDFVEGRYEALSRQP